MFLAPWSRSRSNKNTRSRSRFGKKSGAGAAWKKSQEPEPLKNYPAPQTNRLHHRQQPGTLAIYFTDSTTVNNQVLFLYTLHTPPPSTTRYSSYILNILTTVNNQVLNVYVSSFDIFNCLWRWRRLRSPLRRTSRLCPPWKRSRRSTKMMTRPGQKLPSSRP